MTYSYLQHRSIKTGLSEPSQFIHFGKKVVLFGILDCSHNLQTFNLCYCCQSYSILVFGGWSYYVWSQFLSYFLYSWELIYSFLASWVLSRLTMFLIWLVAQLWSTIIRKNGYSQLRVLGKIYNILKDESCYTALVFYKPRDIVFIKKNRFKTVVLLEH